MERRDRTSGQMRGELVVESFGSEAQAEAAIVALRDAGFGEDEVSVIARDEGRARRVADEAGAGKGEDVAKGTGIGAATGGTLGALGGLLVGATALTLPGVGILVAGPLAAMLGGAGIGAVAGGLAGALSAAGVSEDDARRYEERVREGDILVAVAAGDRAAEASRIMRSARTARTAR